MVTNGHKTPQTLWIERDSPDGGNKKAAYVRGFPGFFGLSGLLVAHRGFEPLISALRGRCPRPLDECAAYQRQIVSAVLTGVHFG